MDLVDDVVMEGEVSIEENPGDDLLDESDACGEEEGVEDDPFDVLKEGVLADLVAQDIFNEDDGTKAPLVPGGGHGHNHMGLRTRYTLKYKAWLGKVAAEELQQMKLQNPKGKRHPFIQSLLRKIFKGEVLRDKRTMKKLKHVVSRAYQSRPPCTICPKPQWEIGSMGWGEASLANPPFNLSAVTTFFKNVTLGALQSPTHEGEVRGPNFIPRNAPNPPT